MLFEGFEVFDNGLGVGLFHFVGGHGGAGLSALGGQAGDEVLDESGFAAPTAPEAAGRCDVWRSFVPSLNRLDGLVFHHFALHGFGKVQFAFLVFWGVAVQAFGDLDGEVAAVLDFLARLSRGREDSEGEVTY